MREYQGLKTSITGIVDSTEAVVDISSALKDHEETKRSLSKVGPTNIISNHSPIIQGQSHHGNAMFMQAAVLASFSMSEEDVAQVGCRHLGSNPDE